jgi:hypothetical protein
VVANGVGLTLNVGEEGSTVISPQPLFDESSEDDLEAHRELERNRRLPRHDPSPVQDVLRVNEEDLRSIREHHPPCRSRRPRPDTQITRVIMSIFHISYIRYILEVVVSQVGIPGNDSALTQAPATTSRLCPRYGGHAHLSTERCGARRRARHGGEAARLR